MRPIVTLQYLLITAIVCCTACTKEEITIAGREGTLTGFIEAYESSSIKADPSGITLTFEGSEPQLKATTDNDGKFHISNLATGTYDIVISKAGYCTHKILGYPFVGGDQSSALNSRIYKYPAIKIKEVSLEAEYIYDWKLYTTVYFDQVDVPMGRRIFFRYYLSNSNNVSFSNYLETGVFYGSDVDSPSTFYTEINTKLFSPGSDLYMIIYPCSDQFLSYLDINTGKEIYSSISLEGSAVKTVKVPMGE